MPQDFRDPNTAREWDADTRCYNPMRLEQLEMLLALVAAEYQPGQTILDLGLGSGQVEALLFERVPGAQVVGVDASAAMLEIAAERLQPYAAQYTTVLHDLAQIDTLALPARDYGIVISIQTLHHLDDAQMGRAYAFIQRTLRPGGLFLLLDRIAVEHANLFGCYQTLWAQQDAARGSQVRWHEGENYAEHQASNRDRADQPLGLARHLELLRMAGFAAACLHLHTHRALFAARRE
jgi:ubiquinone/menaquinone biosynthesis C-methylase UbiE